MTVSTNIVWHQASVDRAARAEQALDRRRQPHGDRQREAGALLRRVTAEVVEVAPRPLLLLHPAKDSVTPTDQSIGLFEHSNQPTELHLISDADHFLMGEGNPRVVHILKDWLDRYFPA